MSPDLKKQMGAGHEGGKFRLQIDQLGCGSLRQQLHEGTEAGSPGLLAGTGIEAPYRWSINGWRICLRRARAWWQLVEPSVVGFVMESYVDGWPIEQVLR